MTRIESVADRPDRAGRFLIKLEDGKTLRLYRQTVEDYGLYPGKELSEEELTQLKQDAGKMSTRMRAVRIISASNVSRADLRERLVRKGEDETQAEEAVKWLSDLDLLDDSRTARQIVEQCARKGYGIARAKQALYEKRIPKRYWETALEDFPDQSEHILTFLRSRLGENWTERDLKKAIDALLRRGHSYGEIRSALNAMQLDADDLAED